MATKKKAVAHRMYVTIGYDFTGEYSGDPLDVVELIDENLQNGVDVPVSDTLADAEILAEECIETGEWAEAVIVELVPTPKSHLARGVRKTNL